MLANGCADVSLFMCMCVDPPCLVSEWCLRGSVYDILAKAAKHPAVAAQLTWHRRISMALDAAKVTGCAFCYLHMQIFHSHAGPLNEITMADALALYVCRLSEGLCSPACHVEMSASIRFLFC